MAPIRKRPASSPSESASGGETTKRKKNISRACTTCRRRRLRCDGNARCSTCVMYQQDCVYEPDMDGRKPATKMFVEALQSRIKVLEDMLGDRSDEDRAEGTDAPAGSSTRSEHSPTAHKVSGSLIMDNETLAHHGPTSVFMHLPEPSEETGLSPTRHMMTWTTDPSQVEWARHLPSSVPLTYDQHEVLLDFFFSYFNGWTWLIDETSFRSDWTLSVSTSNPQTWTPHYSPLLHNAMLSVVCLYIDEPDARSKSMAFAERAASMMEREAERGSCSTVRGLLFLGTHHWALNKRSVAWLYEGTGVRLAQTLGLNVDCSHLVQKNLLTDEAKRERDRCFYTVYLQDQLWSMTLGRAHSLTTQDFETAIPAIDPDVDQQPWLDHKQRAAVRRGEHVQAGPSWMSSTFHHSCLLAGLADRLQRGLYRMRSRHQEATQKRLISELHLELNTWLLNLPSPLRLETARRPLPTHVINMHAMCRYLQILLHRPTYTRPYVATSEARDLAVKTCDFAALEIMRLLREHDHTTGIRYTTTATTNITFTAGTIHLLTAVQPSTPPERGAQAIRDARECIRYLKAMPWFCATKGGEALEKMLADWSIVTRETSPGLDLGRFGSTKSLGDMDSDISKLLLELGWKPPQEMPNVRSSNGGATADTGGWNAVGATAVDWAVPSQGMGTQHVANSDVGLPNMPGANYDDMSVGFNVAANPFDIIPPTVQPDVSSFFTMDWTPFIPSIMDILGPESSQNQ